MIRLLKVVLRYGCIVILFTNLLHELANLHCNAKVLCIPCFERLSVIGDNNQETLYITATTSV